MDAIDLQRPELLPISLWERLESFESLCRGHLFFEELEQFSDFRGIVVDLDTYCTRRKVLGIHYTRAIITDIEQFGLLVRTGAEIRNEFVHRFGHIFEAEELDWLQTKWSSHQVKQSNIRDSMLWFNFTLKAHRGPASKHLLGMYGGEQIHMGVDFDTPIGNKLASIGQPLLIRCSLAPSKVRTFVEHPWGKILASSFHLRVNPEAFRIDQDGKVLESISPEDLTIEPVL